MRLPLDSIFIKDNQLPDGVLVDDGIDLSSYNKFWVSKRGDVITQAEKTIEGRRVRITYRLHRIIMGQTNPLKEVDHINHNKLDNRKENLRVCDHSQNGKNLPLKKNNTSGFSGVSKYKNRWATRIKKNYKNYTIGFYDTIEEAISARLTAENHYYEEFAPNA